MFSQQSTDFFFQQCFDFDLILFLKSSGFDLIVHISYKVIVNAGLLTGLINFNSAVFDCYFISQRAETRFFCVYRIWPYLTLGMSSHNSYHQYSNSTTSQGRGPLDLLL